jgi:hypothetical protein
MHFSETTTMEYSNKDQTLPQLAPSAEAENARLTMQTVDVGSTPKEVVGESPERGDNNAVVKVTSAGLKNYFVSDARIGSS